MLMPLRCFCPPGACSRRRPPYMGFRRDVTSPWRRHPGDTMSTKIVNTIAFWRWYRADLECNDNTKRAATICKSITAEEKSHDGHFPTATEHVYKQRKNRHWSDASCMRTGSGSERPERSAPAFCFRSLCSGAKNIHSEFHISLSGSKTQCFHRKN